MNVIPFLWDCFWKACFALVIYIALMYLTI